MSALLERSLAPRGLLIALACATAGLSSGCIARIAYEPNTGLVDQLGYEAAARELGDVLVRSRNPVVTDVEVAPDAFSFVTAGVVWGWWGVIGNRRVIPFADVGRIDIYENDRAFMIDVRGRERGSFDFNARADSLRFADLVLSFHAWDPARAPEVHPHEPPPDWSAPAPCEEPTESQRDVLRDDEPAPPPPTKDEWPPAEEGSRTRNVLGDD